MQSKQKFLSHPFVGIWCQLTAEIGQCRIGSRYVGLQESFTLRVTEKWYSYEKASSSEQVVQTSACSKDDYGDSKQK